MTVSGNVGISHSLEPNARIWRYMSLDKFIDLLSTKSLYMSPVTAFKKSDPYEGQEHPQVAQLWADIFGPFEEDFAKVVRQMEILSIGNSVDMEAFAALKSRIDHMPEERDRIGCKMRHSVRGCCWHANDGESEAMWKIYGDSGKSVAIVSTVGALASSLLADGIEEVIDIVPVKYLDFRLKYLPAKLKDFKGRITVTKRVAYEHEREIRLTIRPAPKDPREWQRENFGLPNPIRLPVNTGELIQEIQISPYTFEPFASSVKTVCKIFGISPDRIRTSDLLQDELPSSCKIFSNKQ